MPTSELTFDKWWAYVVKREILPTLHNACLPPLIMTPIKGFAAKAPPPEERVGGDTT